MPDKPLISKAYFVHIMDTLSSKRDSFDKLCDIAEDLCPGLRVDFLPNFDYEAIIIDLLSYLLREPVGGPESNTIEYFAYELNFGKFEPDEASSELSLHPGFMLVNDIQYDISTASAVYDTLVTLNFTQQEQEEKGKK